MFDAGHSHLPTGHLVNGCPLCDAEKAQRNAAIDHLSDALTLFANLRRDGDPATVRTNLGPADITSDDVQRCHSYDLSARQIDSLADAVDSLNAYVGSERQTKPSSATVFATQHPQLAAELVDAFAEVDPISLLDDVLNSPNPGKSAEAYEDLVTGETDGGDQQ